jgi:Tol biopolymer transport system component
MARSASFVRVQMALAVFLALSGAGCGDAAEPAGPDVGTLRVSLSTTGTDLDVGGYVVSVGTTSLRAGVNAAVTFEALPPGSHNVLLQEVAPNCSPDQTTQIANVSTGTSNEVSFTVDCVTIRQVVFWRWLGDHRDLFVMATDGSGLVNLTNDAAPELSPAWSPDGTRIAFVAGDPNAEIYVMNADGSARKRLTNNPGEDNFPAWSPDGSRIAFSSDVNGTRDIWVMAADGTGLTNLTHSAGTFDTEPGWSPDGSRIVFQRSGDVWVMDADGSDPVRVMTDGLTPSWSPDASKIAFASYRSGNLDIYVMKPDGSGVGRLTSDPADDLFPAWSPDGSRIAFTSFRTGTGSIHLMRPDGSGVVMLASGTAGESHQLSWKR